jgi:putative hydrolase of the HAD superfamily
MTSSFTAADWDSIRLVAFDVDGTLYNQRSLRLRMAREMLLHTVLKRDLSAIRVVAVYRKIREHLADEETADFERLLIDATAKAASNSPDRVRAIVTEWIEERPLPYLRGCIYPGVVQLFDGLRRSGKRIGILSDYPAPAKLVAMGLSADHVIAAIDVGVLKPHPKGLQSLLAAAGATAEEAIFVGDRADRDGSAGHRAGVTTLIRSSKPIEGWQTFASFRDPLFARFLGC